MEIISLYDFSGEALKPWAHAGYACYAYDIEHPPSGRMSEGIHYEHANLHDEATVQKIIARHKGRVSNFRRFLCVRYCGQPPGREGGPGAARSCRGH